MSPHSRRGFGHRLAALALSLFSAVSVAPHAAAQPDEQAILARSLVSHGDSSRLRAAMLRARRGEPVTVAVIGGSITAGGAASAVDKTYGSLIAQWWRETFPQSEVRFVNAGFGATGTHYALLRARRDLLSHDPDLVVIEFAVNDGDNIWSAPPMEGLVRQILRHDTAAAAMMLFMMRQDGSSTAQQWHAMVGEHYGLPMVSYRDAFQPELDAGRLVWSEIAADVIHPNDRGHAYAASFVIAVLEEVLAGMPEAEFFTEIRPVPAPLFDEVFEKVTLRGASVMAPTFNDGWWYDEANDAWMTETPGSSVEFSMEGNIIFLVHHALLGPMGNAVATIDGESPLVLDGWISAAWSDFHRLSWFPWRTNLAPHQVRVELLEEMDPGSTGHQFRLKALGAAGRPVRDCGDPVDDDEVTSSDALHILLSSVGIDSTCPPWACDVDGDGRIVSSDSLMTLSAAVGFAVEMSCTGPRGFLVRLASADALQRLAFDVDFSATGAAPEEEDGGPRCESLVSGTEATFAVLEDGRMHVELSAQAGGVAGPKPLVWCGLAADPAARPADVTVSVLQAVTVDGQTAWRTEMTAMAW